VRSFASSKTILPTEKIFQASLDGAGACRLPRTYTSCRNTSTSASGRLVPDKEVPFCGDGTLSQHEKRGVEFGIHDFDERVLSVDAYNLNSTQDASLFHYLVSRPELVASEVSLGIKSVYTLRYFDAVLTDLQVRGLELMMRMYGDVSTKTVDNAVSEWKPLFTTSDISIRPFSKYDLEVNGGGEVYGAASTHAKDRTYMLPNNFSRRSEESEVRLPNFAVDFSDYVLGAMIERTSDSFDLYATVFMLCHEIVLPKNGKSAESGETISPEVHDVWKRAINTFGETEYNEMGVRKTPAPFFCNISHTEGAPYYIVEGSFVPNSLTTDSNSNKRLDILRCKMEDTESAYMNLAGSSEEMRVEILRGDVSLLSFRIPWGSRKTGFMLDTPDDQVVTIFDPWKGFNKSTPGVWTHDRLHMCVPGWEDAPSKATLPIFYEWIQHHLLMGADHIFTAMTMSWKSSSFELTRRVLRSFIDEGVLSMNTHAGDDIDFAYR
jgi:hypothetical protein